MRLVDNALLLCNNAVMEHAEFTIQIHREALSTGEDTYNVIDAIESFFEVASPSEIEQRLLS